MDCSSSSDGIVVEATSRGCGFKSYPGFQSQFPDVFEKIRQPNQHCKKGLKIKVFMKKNLT